jgi:hypothetical protein
VGDGDIGNGGRADIAILVGVRKLTDTAGVDDYNDDSLFSHIRNVGSAAGIVNLNLLIFSVILPNLTN